MARYPPQPGIEPATKATTPPSLYLLQIMSVIRRSSALDNGLHTDGSIKWMRRVVRIFVEGNGNVVELKQKLSGNTKVRKTVSEC